MVFLINAWVLTYIQHQFKLVLDYPSLNEANLVSLTKKLPENWTHSDKVLVTKT